jgi:hypothetical protein
VVSGEAAQVWAAILFSKRFGRQPLIFNQPWVPSRLLAERLFAFLTQVFRPNPLPVRQKQCHDQDRFGRLKVN